MACQRVDMEVRCVEPVQRMVGGRFGWAVHRFPIRGGITLAEVARKTWGKALSEAAARPSYLGVMARGVKQ